MVYSKDEELHGFSVIDILYMLKIQQAIQLCLSLHVSLFLMGFSQANEMLHHHKISSHLKVVTISDLLNVLFFSVFIHIFSQKKCCWL